MEFYWNKVQPAGNRKQTNGFTNWEREQYVINKLSAEDIVNKIYNDTKIIVTSRTIQRHISKLGITRGHKEGHLLAYKQGKMDSYLKIVKKPKELTSRKRVRLQLGLRMAVLKRDNYTCKCGNIGYAGNPLQIDHIDNDRNNNSIDNLQVMCRECNQGKYWLSKLA